MMMVLVMKAVMVINKRRLTRIGNILSIATKLWYTNATGHDYKANDTGYNYD